GRLLRAVQLPAAFGQQVGIGMSITAINIAGCRAREQRIGLRWIAALVHGRQPDRRGNRLRRLSRRPIGARTNVVGLYEVWHKSWNGYLRIAGSLRQLAVPFAARTLIDCT